MKIKTKKKKIFFGKSFRNSSLLLVTKAYQGAQFLVCGHTVSTQMKANKELKHSNKESKLAKKNEEGRFCFKFN